MPLSWTPDIDEVKGPLYWRVAAALARDIKGGRLGNGERLPTHRALAQSLGVTVNTVTRAYGELERSGLIVSRIGRGTFVRGFPEEMANGAALPRDLINLSTNTPSNEAFNALFGQVLGALSRRASLHSLFEYHVHPGLDRHRAAGAHWIQKRGFEVPAKNIIVCQGAQEGLLAALSAITRPRDIVLTEKLNYAGIEFIAEILDLNIVGVEIDEEGMVPDALESACKLGNVSAILVNPTNHNPTNAHASTERRQAIADVAARAGVIIIEDDIFGHLTGDETPPLSALAPDRCIYVCGTSKSIAAGLRVGYIHAPDGIFKRIIEKLHKMHWSSPAMMGEVTTMLIESGQADKMAQWHRSEARERQAIACEFLGDRYATRLPSNHLWIPLASGWKSEAFVSALRSRGVLVSPASRFAVDRTPPPEAIRITLAFSGDRERLRQGMTIVAELLEQPPS